jgi:hypothetical protein
MASADDADFHGDSEGLFVVSARIVRATSGNGRSPDPFGGSSIASFTVTVTVTITINATAAPDASDVVDVTDTLGAIAQVRPLESPP